LCCPQAEDVLDWLRSVFYAPTLAGPSSHLIDLKMKNAFPRQAIMNRTDSITQRIAGNVETLLMRRNPLKLRNPPIKNAIYPPVRHPATR